MTGFAASLGHRGLEPLAADRLARCCAGPSAWPCALVAALSFGDLGAIALFGTPNTTTLPLLIYQQLGAYHLDAAAVTALLLVALALRLFRGDRACGRRVRWHAAA